MGTLIGHVLPGAGFVLIGLWHLINTIRNYAKGPWEFETRPWFPLKKTKGKMKYLELYLIIFGSGLSIASELFIGPKKHQPLADDWSIPWEHLNNFEHSSISLFFLIYASIALFTAAYQINIPNGFLHILASLAFSQELLLFHFHSADHMGLEGQYHWLLQLVVFICLICTLMEIILPRSFLVAMVRSMGILLQGAWFIQMGLILWIPKFTPKGCAMTNEDDHRVVRCADEHSRMRAKALSNLQFNWFIAGEIIFTFGLYCFIMSRNKAQLYLPIDQPPHKDGISNIEILDNKTPKASHRHSQGSESSIEMEPFVGMDLER